VIDGYTVRNTGNGGIDFGPGTNHLTIENSTVADIGATGIALSTVFGSRSYPALLGPENFGQSLGGTMTYNTIQNSLIMGVGRVNPSGQGILFGFTNSHGLVENNEVTDTYQTGITIGGDVGWQQYQQRDTHDNTAQLNLVYKVGQGVTSDMGGIYSAGIQKNTVIQQNIVHDVSSAIYGGNGLYLDQTTAYVTMQQNVVWNTSETCFMSHQAVLSVVQDNVFENCSTNPLGSGAMNVFDWDPSDYQVIFGPLYTFRRNIVAWSSKQPPAIIWMQSGVALDGTTLVQDDNVFWNPSVPEIFVPGITWPQWNALGYDAHSNWSDPHLGTAAQLYAPKSSSVLPTGFQNWGHSRAGRTSGVGGVRIGSLPFPNPAPAFY
jgi:hypothetical protein